jgi:hypothetical protein
VIYFFAILFAFYFIYTLNFAIRFNRTDTYFTRNVRLLHHVLIWLVPFFWIMIVKTLIDPTPGSHQLKKRNPDGSFYESGLGLWGNDSSHQSDGGHADGGD